MKIVVTTPSGHVGRSVTKYLLDHGAYVKLLARRPEKLSDFVARGAEVVRGAQDDAEFLIQNTRDMDALLWVTPPGFGSDDLRDFQRRFANAAAEAIRVNRIPRVVNLSSFGADQSTGVGPIGGLHDAEEILNAAGENILHLRPCMFYENFIFHLESIKNDGCFYLPISRNRKVPMIACRDIGRVAADRLLNAFWYGHWTEDMFGPSDLTFDEAAAILSDHVQWTVHYAVVTVERFRKSMIEHGLSENATDTMLELYDAVETQRLRGPDRRAPHTIGTTTLAEFAHDTLLPIMLEWAVH